MVIRMLKGLSKNYKELFGSYREFTGNYIGMKKDRQTTNKSPEEMKNKISEMKTTLEGILKSRYR